MDRSKILIISSLLIGIIFFGIIGYQLIEGWNFVDSFYMTIITLTTTGFGEVHQLSTGGRFFTAFLLVVGMGIFAYSISTLFTAFFSINFSLRRRKKMDRKIEHLDKHTIICGYGRMGEVICTELSKAGYTNFLVIEQEPRHIEQLKKTNYLWLEGNASNDEVLIKAGIKKAKSLISMIDNDADGLYLSLAARSFNPDAHITIRANHEAAKSRILKTGADKVILPYVMSGLKVAQSIINPAIEDFLDIAGVRSDNHGQMLQIVDIKVDDCDLENKTLRTCGFKRDGLIVIGIKENGGKFIFAPSADYNFSKGDTLIAMGTKESCEDIFKELNL